MTDLESLPIRLPSKNASNLIEKLIDRILIESNLNQDIDKLEQNINNIIFSY